MSWRWEFPLMGNFSRVHSRPFGDQAVSGSKRTFRRDRPMKLYGFPPTRTIRALWMLRELDLDFEYVQVDPTKGEHRRPEFLAVNPAGKVPVLVDDDFVLTESAAIVLYLAGKHPQKGFLPAHVAARGE